MHGNSVQARHDGQTPRRSAKRWVQVAAATGLAAAVTLGGYGAAMAATTKTVKPAAQGAATTGRPGPGIGHGPMGAVSAIGASSITVTVGTGTSVTYKTSSSTTYKKDGKAASAADLAVGDVIGVIATQPSSSTSSPTASEIDIFSPSISGTVVSVTSGTITVKDVQGFWHTVNISASTTYEDGGASATAAAVTTGAQVTAIGTVDADHTDLDATDVQVILPSVNGKVTAVSGSTITLSTRSGTVTVTTTASTAYLTSSGTGSASDVTTGSLISAEGQQSSSSALTATSIRILPAPPSGSGAKNPPGGPGGGPGGFGGGPGSFGGPGL